MYEYQMFKGTWPEVSAKIQQEAIAGWRVIGFTTNGSKGEFHVIMERPKRKADKRASAAKSSSR
jgi:hypothetical protein